MKCIKNLVRSLYKRMWKQEWEDFHKEIILPRKLSGFIPISNVKQWSDYYQQNDIPRKLEKLLIGIDAEGQETVNNVLRRHQFFMNSYNEFDSYYFEPENWLTEKEKQECERIDISKYENCFPVNFYERSVLFYHCGLKLLSNKCLKYIQEKDFIDGGACIGDSAMIFTEYQPKMVYAFEPLKRNQKYIAQTIKINKLKTVQPVNLGLGDKNETVELMFNSENIGGASLTIKTKSDETETIDITTIDTFVVENKLNLGLIKLDVEGFESNIILGAEKSIKSHRPIMLISLYHRPEDFFDIKTTIESWDLNYAFKIAKLAPESLHCEVMLIAYPAELEE